MKPCSGVPCLDILRDLKWKTKVRDYDAGNSKQWVNHRLRQVEVARVNKTINSTCCRTGDTYCKLLNVVMIPTV